MVLDLPDRKEKLFDLNRLDFAVIIVVRRGLEFR